MGKPPEVRRPRSSNVGCSEAGHLGPRDVARVAPDGIGQAVTIEITETCSDGVEVVAEQAGAVIHGEAPAVFEFWFCGRADVFEIKDFGSAAHDDVEFFHDPANRRAWGW